MLRDVRPQRRASTTRFLLRDLGACAMPNITLSAEIVKSLPRNQGGVFCLPLFDVAKSVAIRIDRTRLFATEVKDSNASTGSLDDAERKATTTKGLLFLLYIIVENFYANFIWR